MKELILDRILFVALNDYALPVLEKIQKVAATMDVVLLSHFTLEVGAPPGSHTHYSSLS